MKWGNHHELFFSIFSIENELFTENVKKGVRCNKPNGRTVQPTQLILIFIEADFRALQRIFFEFHFSFWVILFSSEKCIFAKKTELPDGVIFFQNSKLEKKNSP